MGSDREEGVMTEEEMDDYLQKCHAEWNDYLGSRFRFFDVHELLALPPPRWLVHGLLPEHSLSVLYGASGAGKSFVALDIAASVVSDSTGKADTYANGPSSMWPRKVVLES